ncbi:MAG: hypothetical protein FJW61_09650 [Actinobacteria bacterium]|nr:hypothetical protein [Actinomycetota bacterium]
MENNARDIINEGSKLIFNNINCDVFTFNMVSSEKDNTVIPNGLYVDRGYEGFIRAYSAAAALSSEIHVKYIESPLKQAVQVIPECYDEVWTAAKGSYKLQKQGVMADGGEIILYGPHISCFHSDKKIEEEIKEAGYHCKDYIKYYIEKHPEFCRNSAAHLINVSGPGEYNSVKNIERRKFRVTLATGIPEDICEKVNLGYRNPDTLKKSDFAGKEKIWIEDGGKYLYELKK